MWLLQVLLPLIRLYLCGVKVLIYQLFNRSFTLPGLNLVAHPRAKSKVWKYFGFDTDADGCILHWKRIYCRICMSQIAYSGNTSNLSYHLEKNHPNEFAEFVKSNTDHMREVFGNSFPRVKPEPPSSVSALSSLKPPALPDAAGLRQSLGYENRRHNDLTLAVVNLVCEGMHPPSLVEERTFRALLRTADPRYTPPSRSDLALKMLPQMYFHARDAVASEVAGVVNCGVTAELWQSHTQNRTYVSLALHAVNHSGGAASSAAGGGFSVTSKCLKTFEVREDNAAESITRAMYEAFVEWGITHKVSGATTDGSPDVSKACSLLELSVQMPCLGHAVRRGMDDALELPRVEAFLTRCRKLVDHFRQTAVAAYLLKEKQRQQQQQQHGGRDAQCAATPLLKDRGRCWLSTLAMLRRLRQQQAAVTAALAECGASEESHHIGFTAGDWALAEGLAEEVLQPFKVVADMMTSCKHPTISTVRPVLHMLLNTTLKTKEGDLKEVGMAKEVLAKALADAYSQTPEISAFLNVAAFLDPRYKRLPFLSPQERARVEGHVVEEAKAILEKQASEQPSASSCPDDFSLSSDEPPSKKQAAGEHAGGSNAAPDNPLAAIFCQSDSDQSQAELHAQVVEELSNYKSQRILGLNEDPLLWWSNHAALFPTLPKVLQKYWCVPATVAPCHRLFGASGGSVLCGKRNRLAPALVDQQVFLYENSRSLHEPDGTADHDLEDGAVWDACGGGYALGPPLE